jgi:uncharacterized protein YndB with AHSA1/START domain
MQPTEAKHTLEVTTPSEREIVMTRVVAAPRDVVYDAFTKPELIRRWLLGPDGWTMPVCDQDLRPGGSLRYEWRSDADGTQFGISGVFREIVPPERIVRTEIMDGFPGEALITTTFVERAGATVVTMTTLYDSAATRDIALNSGMAEGVEASYGRLERVLA